jgi:guanylate kinase
VVNDDLNRAYGDVKTIVAAERMRARRIQAGVEQLVERLMAE